MAARSSGHVVGSAAPGKTRADYDADFYSWSMEQARLLRQAQWTHVDRGNVAEEIESLGREQFNKLESAFRVLLLHMLKWDHQPRKRSRSWVLSIKQQRLEIEEALFRAYRKARLDAAKETDLDETIFPARCPYGFEELISRDYSR